MAEALGEHRAARRRRGGRIHGLLEKAVVGVEVVEERGHFGPQGAIFGAGAPQVRRAFLGRQIGGCLKQLFGAFAQPLSHAPCPPARRGARRAPSRPRVAAGARL